MARILVIDDDTSLLQMMSLMLKRAGHEPILANDGHKGIEIARRLHPDIAVVDIMMPDITGHEVCRILREDPETSDIPLLVLTALNQVDQREAAAESGADDFVNKPVTRDDLVGRVEVLLRTGPRNYPLPSPPPMPAPAAEPAPPARREAHPHPVAARVVTPGVTAVMGLTSGAGATTLAVNLALALAEGSRTCLVDLHPYDGRAAIHLRMAPPRSTWADLLDVPPGGDKRRIGAALSFDRGRGLALLAAPVEPTDRLLNPDQLGYIVEVLAEAFPQIVISLPMERNLMTAEVLCLARQMVLVMGEDPADLLPARERLQRIEAMGLPGDVLVVLSRTRPYGISTDDVVESINRPLAATIPYEPAQVQALTDGVPLIISQPGSLFAQSVRQLARQL